jgi:histidinol-phosphate phosphatase family protein
MKDLMGAAVFFDRDGTINEDVGYLSTPDELKMINGAASAIKRLNAIGVKVIVVSNQSGVGRGYFNESAVEAVNLRLASILAEGGASVDGVYYCVHAPDEECDCRKPRAGMAERASRNHAIDLKRSYVVGDKASDMGLADNIGAKSVLVLTGEGQSALEKLKRKPHFVAADITGAVDWIIEDMLGSQ